MQTSAAITGWQGMPKDPDFILNCYRENFPATRNKRPNRKDLSVTNVQSNPAPAKSRRRLKDITFIVMRILRARSNLVAAWPKFCYRQKIIMFRVLWGRVVIVNEPEGVQWVMATNSANYPKSRASMQMLKPLLGNGLFVSEGALWTRQRRIAAPAAHGNRLAGYSDVIIEEGRNFAEAWRKLPPGTELDMTEAFTLLTAEIISRLMFGYRLGAQVNTLYEAFVQYQASHGRMHLSELIGVPDWFPRPSMFNARRAVKKFDGVLHAIIEAGRDANGEIPENLIQMLVNYRDDKGQPMNPRLIRDEVASIFLAGHETTAITLSWAFYLLDQHPETAARLHTELDAVLGGRTPAFADVPKLVFTRAVIDETLRLYPPVHVFSKQAVADDVILGHKVPAGSFVTVSSWVLHRHELYWREPNRFDPDRFLPNAPDAIHPYAYIPFGAGSRVCLGKHLGILEAVLLLAIIAQSFRLKLRPGHPAEPVGRMTLRPDGGMPMSVEPRR